MDEHKVQSLSRVYAPNEYAVWLSPEDRKQFEGYEDELARELSGYLLEHARRERIALVTQPADRRSAPTSGCGSASSASRRGSCSPPAREHEQPSQGDEGHTMVYSVSDRVAEPLREPDPRRGAARLRVGRRGPSCVGSAAARCSAARATRRRRSTTRTSRATTPRCGRPAARGSSTTSARPTASRSTAAASDGPQSLKRGDVIELGTSRVTFELE